MESCSGEFFIAQHDSDNELRCGVRASSIVVADLVSVGIDFGSVQCSLNKDRPAHGPMACVAIDTEVRRLFQSLMACRSPIACRSTCLKELSSARATQREVLTASPVSKRHDDTWSHESGSHHRSTKSVTHSHRYQDSRIRILRHTAVPTSLSAVASV